MNEQIRQDLQAIDAKLQEVEAKAESMFPEHPSDNELNVVTGIVEARIQVRELLRSITPTETFSGVFRQSLKDASQPRDHQQN